MKQYVVFMCSKCKGFTNAPADQKKRRCSYCGSIIDITKANLALFDSPEQASNAVKEFNASKGGNEFKNAVERSRERVKALMPSEHINTDDITTKGEESSPQGNQRRLMAILEKEARGTSCTLDRLEELTTAGGLSWVWVEKQIESLSNSGALLFPRPWTVQLVIPDDSDIPTQISIKDVSLEIIEFLRQSGKALKVDEIVSHFKKKGVSEASVDSSLERLLRSGDIFQPTTSTLKLV
ncbi:MAG: DUF1922 domain-containing protein [Candidatus Thorarchaeota archaeon]|nr:MAG: DUF1922 domain-containing protein [Candidatus Thorarchaeota archaeon]